MLLRGAAGNQLRATKQSPCMHNQIACDEIASPSDNRTSLLAMTKRLYNLKPIKKISFRLPDFPTFGLVALLTFGLFISACISNPNFQGRGETALQGEWKQDSIAGQKALLTYSLYDVKFECDSFLFRIDTYSKVNNGADNCSTDGHKIEYVKGTYRQRNDSLFVKGMFCKADRSLRDEGSCYRSGPYQDIFKVGPKADSLLQIRSISSITPINAHLLKRTTCTPKPL